jgi:hypothetical protein
MKLTTKKRSKKIGIITFHDGINYGGFFQAYSFYIVLKNILKTNVEFVDYKNPRHWFLENLVFYHRILDPKYLVGNISKISKFRKFQKLLKKSNKVFFAPLLMRHRYDYIFYGSDEIWNFRNPLVGYDLVYFGMYTKSNKISYASSFGSIEVSEKLPNSAIKGLATFKNISVRDENSQKVILKNLKQKVPIVLDPTLLLDDILREAPPKDKNYILVYSTIIGEPFIRSIKEFARKHNKQLISIGYSYKWCDKSYVDVGPDEFLGFYKSADFVITSMFHGTIFAIKYKTRFISIVTKYRKNKIIGLLKNMGLLDRVLDNPSELTIKLLKYPNYRKVFNNIRKKRKESFNFLKESLET